MIENSAVIRVGVCGASGRMGQEVTKIINNQAQYQLSATHSSQDDDGNLSLLCQKSDVVIDFSAIDVLPQLLHHAKKNIVPLVIGTTGLSKEHEYLMRETSNSVPIFYSPNMSLAANVMNIMIEKIARLLNSDYDVEIIEMHHKSKVDIPSGTAIMLGKAVAKGRNIKLNHAAYFEQNSELQQNDNDFQLTEKSVHNFTTNEQKKNYTIKKNDIGFSSIRAGEMQGRHEVMFIGQDDILSVQHQSMNRSLFAKGALIAAEWLLGRNKIGLYSFIDLLNSNLE
ncbi:4-hydroxy-tetrahydrodipicolinate reductase [Orientia tsutsugamushi]|uniref:4-hydroxy-tetrahydrodipicolinate reductase n=1 Tax=Orientia tsutsugamushi TaxID=784 RepID=UPI0035280B6E